MNIYEQTEAHGDTLLCPGVTTRCRYCLTANPPRQQASCRHGNLERERPTLVSQMESVVRVLYANGTSLNLRSKKINEVPECVSRLTNLSALRLNNNSISALPAALRSLRHVSVCDRCELICSLEIFQDDSLNVLHTTQICD